MNRRLPSAWFGIVVVLTGQSAPTTAAASRQYTSPAGYALRYPAAWTRADGSPIGCSSSAPVAARTVR